MSGTIQIFDSHSGEILQELLGHEGQTRGLDWNPDGSRLATAGGDSLIRISTVEKGKEGITNQTGPYRADHLDWSPDGTRLVSSDPRWLSIWDGRDRAGE
jgi:WD40 repeat protein